MKSQDILLLLKLLSIEQSGIERSDLYSLRSLESAIGVSKTELGSAMNRCEAVGLLIKERLNGFPRVNRRALLGLLVNGIRYVFPAKPASITRGLATAFAAPILSEKIMSAGELPFVWPDAHGDLKGQSITPLFKSAAESSKKDPQLYSYLALVDAIRIGKPREVEVASKLLEQEFNK